MLGTKQISTPTPESGQFPLTGAVRGVRIPVAVEALKQFWHMLVVAGVPAKPQLLTQREVSFDSELGTVTINSKIYTAKQMHWHSPAEHNIDGVRYPLELHVVHKAADGRIAVVAVLFKYGNSDLLLSEIQVQLKELNDDDDNHIPITSLNTVPLQHSADKYYRYDGSLTTPPCDETVTWTVLAEVREVSEDQVKALRTPLRADCKNNDRPLQALNNRRVEKYEKDP